MRASSLASPAASIMSLADFFALEAKSAPSWIRPSAADIFWRNQPEQNYTVEQNTSTKYLTSYSRVLLGKLIVLQLVKKFPIFY